MANLNKKIKLGKKGVNYVTDIVDSNNSNFNNIIQENDIGTDGIIEIFTKSGTPTSKLIAVQIKTGKSYYNEQRKLCTIPIETHSSVILRFPKYQKQATKPTQDKALLLSILLRKRRHKKRAGIFLLDTYHKKYECR